jgi:hypothetical protein
LRKIVESIRRGGQWTKTAEEDSKEDKKKRRIWRTVEEIN